MTSSRRVIIAGAGVHRFHPRHGVVQAGEVANHPFAVVEFPVHRRAPLFAVDCCPSFGKPPAEVLVATVAEKFEKVAIAYECAVERIAVVRIDTVREAVVVRAEHGHRSVRTLSRQAHVAGRRPVRPPRRRRCGRASPGRLAPRSTRPRLGLRGLSPVHPRR